MREAGVIGASWRPTATQELLLRATVFRPDPVPVTLFRAARGTVEETVTNTQGSLPPLPPP